MSTTQVHIAGWMVALLLLVAYGWYCARVVRRTSAEALSRVSKAAYQAGLEDGRREMASVGICGDKLEGPWGNLDPEGPGPFGVIWCDLRSGHAGWHETAMPGSPHRTSWTHGADTIERWESDRNV